MWFVKGLLFVGVLSTVLYAKEEKPQDFEKLRAGERVITKSVVYYSKPLRMDLKQNGVRNYLVMAAKIFIKETPKGYKGYFVRGLYDIKNNKVAKYYVRTTPDGRPIYTHTDIALSHIKVNKKSVTFDYNSLHYALRDGGKGYANDEMSVILNKKTRYIPLYGGDIKIDE